MTADTGLPPALRVLELATAGWMSGALSAVAALGVADELASGPRPVDEVAAALDCHGPSLYRLLRACADLGLFVELDDRRFGLTEVGQALRTDRPGSMRGFATWVGLPSERHTWADLVGSVRTGRPAYAGVHGQPVWDHLRTDPYAAGVFDQAMTEVSAQVNPAVVSSYDFTGLGTVVDVGGGRGALIAAVLTAFPGVRGVLHDQRDVVAGAGELLAAAGVADRCRVVAGDFLESVPAGGDAYLLSNVLHNWDDEPATRILANCRAAMAGGGRVLLVETLLPATVEPALTAKLMDLDMLLLCGGRQRTPAEFGELFRRAGLRLSRIVRGDCSVVEALAA